MGFHLRREIDVVKQHILKISAAVEKSVHEAIRALERKDVQMAQRVIDADEEIDQMEVELEEECLKILALHQPVAIDLRYLVAILKINSDLERIGDLAANIAQAANVLARQEHIRIPDHIAEMSEHTVRMLHVGLDALLNLDGDSAQEVLDMDDTIDQLHKKTFDLVEAKIQENPGSTPEYIRLLGISRNLERMADHTTNIAEDVIYMISGDIIRHHLGGVDGT